MQTHIEPHSLELKAVVTYGQVEVALKAVPVNLLDQVYAYLLELAEDAADAAYVDAHRGDPTISLGQVLADSGLTVDEVAAVARSEGCR